MDYRIKFLEHELKILYDILRVRLYTRNAQTLVYHNLTAEVNHITDRIRHYSVHLHTKCETTDDFIAYCKEVDNEFENAGQEHLFCVKFDIPYTGKLDKSVLIYFKDDVFSRIREVNSLHIENKRLYINGKIIEHDIRRFIFADKTFELDKNDDVEFNELIEHFKSLKERLKLQDIGEDFK